MVKNNIKQNTNYKNIECSAMRRVMTTKMFLLFRNLVAEEDNTSAIYQKDLFPICDKDSSKVLNSKNFDRISVDILNNGEYQSVRLYFQQFYIYI